MAKYIAEIKEVGNESILKPSIDCEYMTKEQIIRFFGLDGKDVEWYCIYQLVDGKEVKI